MIPRRIIWHHSADNSTAHQFEKINRYHKSRDFLRSSLGFYVGYHYLIEWDGTIKKAREENEIGAHDTGENLNSIGICLAGDFSTHLPSETQVKQIAKLVTEIKSRWDIPITRIEPHRWDDDTECPGKFLKDNWLVETYLEHEGNTMLRAFLWIGKKFNLL